MKIKRRMWTKDEEDYLSDNWGSVSIRSIAKNLGRSTESIIQKARRSKLGPFLEAGDFITVGALMKVMGAGNSYSYTKQIWIDEGLPVKRKRVLNSSFQIVYIDEFWRWAKKNKTLIDFSGMEKFILGKEPDWVSKQREIDCEANFFIKTPWTDGEDYLLESLVDSYSYTYREVSLRLRRTEGAIKRRLVDLDIRARPVRLSNHNPWSEQETEKLIELYNLGHGRNTLPNYINRSSQACSGKIERLIRDEVLKPRTGRKISC